jgi:hypothetical protein
MPKQSRWTREQEELLIILTEKGCSISEISKKVGKSYASVASKMQRLGISVTDNNKEKKSGQLLASTLKLPDNLPSIEDQLRVLAGVIDELQAPGLARHEVMRLRTVINGVRAYMEYFADYVGYREIEEQVEETIRELRILEEAEGMEGTKQQN